MATCCLHNLQPRAAGPFFVRTMKRTRMKRGTCTLMTNEQQWSHQVEDFFAEQKKQFTCGT